MGEARRVMDRATEAIISSNWEAVAACYSPDAVGVTPDQGEVKGQESIVGYLRPFTDALSDLRWEPLYTHECGNTAVDEGFIVGTHTGPLAGPDGETIAPTGKTLRLRECDVATVENGVITSHRFYFDQTELLAQLGLMP